MKRPSGSSNNSLTVRISSLYGRIFLELPTRVGLCVIAFADPSVGIETNGEVKALKSSKAPTNYFTPNILRKSWSRLVVSVVHLDALAFPVAAT